MQRVRGVQVRARGGRSSAACAATFCGGVAGLADAERDRPCPRCRPAPRRRASKSLAEAAVQALERRDLGARAAAFGARRRGGPARAVSRVPINCQRVMAAFRELGPHPLAAGRACRPTAPAARPRSVCTCRPASSQRSCSSRSASSSGLAGSVAKVQEVPASTRRSRRGPRSRRGLGQRSRDRRVADVGDGAAGAVQDPAVVAADDLDDVGVGHVGGVASAGRPASSPAPRSRRPRAPRPATTAGSVSGASPWRFTTTSVSSRSTTDAIRAVPDSSSGSVMHAPRRRSRGPPRRPPRSRSARAPGPQPARTATSWVRWISGRPATSASTLRGRRDGLQPRRDHDQRIHGPDATAPALVRVCAGCPADASDVP